MLAPCAGARCQWPLPSAGGSQGMAGWRRRPSPEAGTRLARLLGPASWSGLQLPPGRRGGTTLSRLLSGREQPAASRPPVCWCVRGDRRGPAMAGSVLCTIHHRRRRQWLGQRACCSLWGPRAGTVHVRGGKAYRGPLNWFPDRCCRMEGLELAASPSFLQTTWGRGEA